MLHNLFTTVFSKKDTWRLLPSLSHHNSPFQHYSCFRFFTSSMLLFLIIILEVTQWFILLFSRVYFVGIYVYLNSFKIHENLFRTLSYNHHPSISFPVMEYHQQILYNAKHFYSLLFPEFLFSFQNVSHVSNKEIKQIWWENILVLHLFYYHSLLWW